MKKVFIFFAEGFEEIEGLTVVDMMRRAGIDISMVSIGTSKMVKGSHGITIETDLLFDEVKEEEGDMFVLPGGLPGTHYLRDHEGLGDLLKVANEKGKYLAAICAAPIVLGKYGMLDGKNATCYPGQEDGLGDATYIEEKVVVDHNIITGRGMGAAISFAGELIAVLTDVETKEQILESIRYGEYL